MKLLQVALVCALLLLSAGCTNPLNHDNGMYWVGNSSQEQGTEGNVNQDSQNLSGAGNANYSQGPGSQAKIKYTKVNVKSFRTFTDPNEGAFSLEVPSRWTVSQGSGLIRPYIDAAVLFEAKSSYGQGVFSADPYGYMYVTPNAVLEFAGFTEGSFYDPSGGVSNPMIVKNYEEAQDFALELLEKRGVDAENVEVTERPDLLTSGNPMVTTQSAAELTFEYESDGKEMESSVIVRTLLIEMSGTGIWYASVMEYYAPAELMNKTELLVLNMQRSFKIDEEWAAREQIEVQKRMGILAQSQNEISDIISSTFEMKSQSLDELNEKWEEYILDIENVYNPETGEHYIVDSGSNYYWIDNIGTIYGTEIDENPLPNENLVQLQCPNC